MQSLFVQSLPGLGVCFEGGVHVFGGVRVMIEEVTKPPQTKPSPGQRLLNLAYTNVPVAADLPMPLLASLTILKVALAEDLVFLQLDVERIALGLSGAGVANK